ncbi:MAG: J domain-containing protein [Cyanobacteria bacterium HKST-UBA01]|nr:J domain-containing protein [Cyanobacteria bacterium HKST-UBA01]
MTSKEYSVDELEAFYRLFGLEPGTPWEEVKREYRMQSQAVHPDKFSEGSSAQKWAHDKFVTFTEAKEALEEFLKSNPQGVPEGGWPSQNRKKQESEKTYESHRGAEEGYSNWEEWKHASTRGASTQSEATRTVLDEWKQEQDEREQKLKTGFTRSERAKVVFWTRVMIPIALFLMYVGSCTSGHIAGMQSDMRDPEKDYLLARYNLGKISETEFRARVKKINDEDFQKSVQLWASGLSVWAFFLLYLYVMIAPRPRAIIDKWVEGESAGGSDA